MEFFVLDDGLPKGRELLKLQRQQAVDAIKVTTEAGNTFDGNEISQDRMERAISTLERLKARLDAGNPLDLSAFGPIYRIVDGHYETLWVLADNTPTYVHAAELAEALALAGATQASVWVI